MTDNNVKLRLRFDADQVTKALSYKFAGPKGPIFQKSGRCAGTFHFPTGAGVDVKVVGTAKTSDEMTFSIVDFTLVCVPSSRPGDQSLSVFSKNSACVRVEKWGDSETTEQGGLATTTVRSPDALTIEGVNGQWEISGFLSVLITKLDENGERTTTPRLFHFDPEGTAGTGGDGPANN